MSKKRVLLMYISKNSGHHHASSAIENAIHELSDDVETLNVDSFCYTNPILEKIVSRTYMSIIKRTPDVWGYLYDNPRIVKKTQKLREAIHRYNSTKMKKLLEGFAPKAVICTQAFPCGIVADYKKTYRKDILLTGALTDYAPHSYWICGEEVDLYFVPSEETRERLMLNGIPSEKINLTGIPIDPKFKKIIDKKKIADSLSLSQTEPIVLVMGGSQGIGPIIEIIKALNNSGAGFQIIVVCGRNNKLRNILLRKSRKLKKKMVVLGYADNIDEIMAVSSLIISKPGGITISEAMSKGLPIIIVRPIPGHESMNTDYLVRNKVAIKAERLQDLEIFITELLQNPSSLKNMQLKAKEFSRPDSALDVARMVLQRIM